MLTKINQDLQAVFDRDPAATSTPKVILTYDATMDHPDIPDPISDRFLALERELIELRTKLENPNKPPHF